MCAEPRQREEQRGEVVVPMCSHLWGGERKLRASSLINYSLK